MSIRTDVDGITEVNIMGKTMCMMFTHSAVEKCKTEKDMTPIEMVFFNNVEEKDVSKNIMDFITDTEKVVYLLSLGLRGYLEAYKVAEKIGMNIIAMKEPTDVSCDDLKIILSSDFKTLQEVNMAVVYAVKKLTALSQEKPSEK